MGWEQPGQRDEHGKGLRKWATSVAVKEMQF